MKTPGSLIDVTMTLQPASGTDVVPRFNSVRTELLIPRSPLSGMTLASRWEVSMLVVILASVVACGYQALSAQHSVVIRQHQVGPVSIGASAQSIYAAFRGRSRLIDLALEGYLTPALELSFPETLLDGGVVAELVPRDNDLVVWRIAVTNPNVRTEKGIGVGSSVAQLRSTYRITGVGSGEGRVFVMVAELAASFELDRSRPGGDSLWQIRDPEQVPGEIKIVSVLLIR